MQQVTMREIAEKLGVSAMAVSLALRGRPGVSQEMRTKILALSKDMGYRPDPVAAELMAQMRARKRNIGSEVIAFINTFKDPSLMKKYATFRSFFRGACDRGEEYGYHVNEFIVNEGKMTGKRLSEILRSRGVRGILIGPRWIDEPDLDFQWNYFSSVVVGEAHYGARLNRVCNHHLHTMVSTLRELWKLGYRRILIHHSEIYERVREYDHLLGLDLFRHEHPEAKDFNLLLRHKWNPEEFAEVFSSWKPDAVVSHGTQPGEWIEKWTNESKQHCGYANLDLPENSKWSGINQNPFEIGRAAIDMLRIQLLNGTRGINRSAQLLLVEGEWVSGNTTRNKAKLDSK